MAPRDYGIPWVVAYSAGGAIVWVVRYLLIVNPKAGRHRARARGQLVAEGLREAGHSCTVTETRTPHHATELAAAGRDFDVVVAVGGDGTLNEVLGGLVQPHDPSPQPLLGMVPAGSGDSVAMDLGILDEHQALSRLLAGEVRAIDLARIDLEPVAGIGSRALLAANVLAWGAGARINRRAEGMRWAGAARYNVATVVELIAMGRGAAAAIVDGEKRPRDLLGVASLTRHSGRGLLLAPEAKLDDGKVDLVHIQRSSRLHLARTFGAVFRGAHLELAGVTWSQVESFTLELGEAGELVVDGELVACDRATVTVLPGALAVIA